MKYTSRNVELQRGKEPKKKKKVKTERPVSKKQRTQSTALLTQLGHGSYTMSHGTSDTLEAPTSMLQILTHSQGVVDVKPGDFQEDFLVALILCHTHVSVLLRH